MQYSKIAQIILIVRAPNVEPTLWLP